MDLLDKLISATTGLQKPSQTDLADMILAALRAAELEEMNPETKIKLYSAILEIESLIRRWTFRGMERGRLIGIAYASRANVYCYELAGDPSSNMEAAIADYDTALKHFSRESMPDVWALTHMNRANAYFERIRGERDENLEVALCGHNAALSIFTKDESPHYWALTHMNRANVFRNRIQGERSENLENAISGYDAALQIRTREDMPVDWAITLLNRATAYSDRILGNHAENIERAVADHDNALTILTRDFMPRDWARTHMNRAGDCLDRAFGEPSQNVEQALADCEAALSVFTRETNPVDWARTQMVRGNAHAQRSKGHHSDNLELAIACYEASLTVFSRAIMPVDWGQTKLNLANAYTVRLRGDRSENIELAIACCDDALTLFERETMPTHFADVLMARANAFCERLEGDRSKNLEAAISDYDLALEVRTQHRLSNDSLALTQLNRATTYLEREQGDRSKNLETAIAGLEFALTIFSQKNVPSHWARTNMLLGIAYMSGGPGAVSENLEAAIQFFSEAIGYYRAETFPIENMRICYYLAEAYLRKEDHRAASETLTDANIIADRLIGEGLNAIEVQRVLKNAISIGPLAALAAARNGDALGALTALDAGRARQLSVALNLDAARTGLRKKERMRFDAIRSEISNIEQYLNLIGPNGREQKIESLIALRSELNALIKKGHAVSQIEKAGVKENLETVTNSGVTVAAHYYFRDEAFVIIANSHSKGLSIESEKIEGDFLQFSNAIRDAWSNHYKSGAFEVAVDQISSQLWGVFGSELVRLLNARNVPPGSQLAILAQGQLGQLPLGLACDPKTNESIFERYELSFSPSIAALACSQPEATESSIAAVVNPTGDLNFAAIEGVMVSQVFESASYICLHDQEASVSESIKLLKGKSYWHFACHGGFDRQNPRSSGLKLAQGETLTIEELFNVKDLGSPRLVVLSACETGVHEIYAAPEEFIGLPTAFLRLGAKGVLATLWPVDDASTALLVSRFFHHHIAGDMRPAAALRAAQLWLRDLTVKDLRTLKKETGATEISDALSSLLAGLKGDRKRLNASEKPFQDPYYWGGFVLYGQ